MTKHQLITHLRKLAADLEAQADRAESYDAKQAYRHSAALIRLEISRAGYGA